MSLLMAQTASVNPSLLEIMDHNECGTYYTDLELAAAIGKNLLERNKELELLLYSTQEYADEQLKRSEYLSRQLEDARETNESRVKLMEQIESNSEELSRSHSRLQRETKSIQEHNQMLTESLHTLVEKCDHYKNEMEGLKQENARLQRQLSTTQNSEETTVPEQKPSEKELVENEVKKLSVAIKELKCEQDREKSTREELENELTQLIIQNQNLEQKLRLFARGSRNSYAEENEREIKEVSKEEEQKQEEPEEVDDDDEEYMNESFVLVESQDIEDLESDQSLEQCDISFLDEVDQQYRDLVTKYNALLEKCKSEGVPYESREMFMVQRGVQTSEVEVGPGEDQGVRQDTVPEYKKLFAMIYEKIREGKD